MKLLKTLSKMLSLQAVLVFTGITFDVNTKSLASESEELHDDEILHLKEHTDGSVSFLKDSFIHCHSLKKCKKIYKKYWNHFDEELKIDFGLNFASLVATDHRCLDHSPEEITEKFAFWAGARQTEEMSDFISNYFSINFKKLIFKKKRSNFSE